MKKNEQREGLHVATITKSEFAHKIQAMIASVEKGVSEREDEADRTSAGSA
jgi:hypothetical protein